jgi:hypothetical protein
VIELANSERVKTAEPVVEEVTLWRSVEEGRNHAAEPGPGETPTPEMVEKEDEGSAAAPAGEWQGETAATSGDAGRRESRRRRRQGRRDRIRSRMQRRRGRKQRMRRQSR